MKRTAVYAHSVGVFRADWRRLLLEPPADARSARMPISRSLICLSGNVAGRKRLQGVWIGKGTPGF
jgi:hypothetical protein